MIKIYKCKHCGNIVAKIEDKNTPLTCCGEHMQELIAGTTDGAKEKHIPVAQIDDENIKVIVGEVLHPMLEEHFIEWVLIVTETGFQIKYLKPSQEPIAYFKTTEKVLEVYEYCNLHGLWKTAL